MPEITKVMEAKLSSVGLTTEDRSLLANIARLMEKQSWSAPSSTAGPSKGGNVSHSKGEQETEAELEQELKLVMFPQVLLKPPVLMNKAFRFHLRSLKLKVKTLSRP